MIKVEEIVKKYKDYEVDEEKLKEFLIPPKSKTVWDLKVGDVYYWTNSCGEIASCEWSNCETDVLRRAFGNCFLTREDAEFEVMRRKVETTLLKYGRRKFKQGKINYYIYNDLPSSLINSNYHIDYHEQGVIYFDTNEQYEEAIIAAGKDNIKKYIFGVKD